MPDAPRIWIDASGMLTWEHSRVTGIQRVEATLLREALRGDKEPIGIAAYSRLSNEWRPLSPASRSFLKTLIDIKLDKDAREPPASSLLVKFDHFTRWQTRSLRYEIARQVAGKESGLVFEATKGLLRGFLAVSRPFARASAALRRWTGRSSCVLMDGGNAVLFSYAGFLAHNSDVAFSRRRSALCHVFYDLIPIDHPEWFPENLRPDFVAYAHRLLRQHDRIFAISQSSRDRLIGWSREQGSPHPDVTASPLGAFLSAIQDTTEASCAIPQLAGKRFAVYCATIEPRKNHVTLVRTWQRLAEDHGIDALPHLVFFGKYGWDYDEVKQLISDTPVRDIIHVITDARDSELSWAYRNAEFGLFPSLAEGWGLGVSESLANGLPVLISDAASLNEAAQGLMPVIPARDVDAWSREIRGLLEDPDALAQLRKRASRYEPRTEREYAGEIFAGMQELISESGRPAK